MSKFHQKIATMTPRRKYFTLSKRKAVTILEEIQELEDFQNEAILQEIVRIPVQTACSTKPIERFAFLMRDGIIIRSKQDWRVYQNPTGYSRLFMRDNSADYMDVEWPCEPKPEPKNKGDYLITKSDLSPKTKT